jgi:hypothetical protein
MSFKLFIYYSALCGGWAAFVAALLVFLTGVREWDAQYQYWSAGVLAAILGLMLAAAVGGLDAFLNTTGLQRGIRVVVCIVVGVLGGFLGGLAGEWIRENVLSQRLVGWILVGSTIGISVGVYDLVTAAIAKQALRMASRKIVNGLIGGVIGGLIGGLAFELLRDLKAIPRFSLAFGLVCLGICVGLAIGLAQVILKEAWLKVEAGFRPGREIMLNKPDILIGRAESCDIGLFGDTGVDKSHARILLQGRRYVLADAGSNGGTFLNEQKVTQPTTLRSGDLIKVGNSVLRFGEREKREEKKR